MARVGIDREAEQHQLHQRNAEHHPEGEPVAPHLLAYPQFGGEVGHGERAVAVREEMSARLVENALAHGGSVDRDSWRWEAGRGH